MTKTTPIPPTDPKPPEAKCTHEKIMAELINFLNHSTSLPDDAVSRIVGLTIDYAGAFFDHVIEQAHKTKQQVLQ